MQPDGGLGSAVAEGVLQQIGDDLGHRAAVAAPLGQRAWRAPVAAREGSAGGGALQQGGQRLGQGLALRAAQQGGQQQRLRSRRHRRAGLSVHQIADGIDVAVQLTLLGQQPIDQFMVFAAGTEAALQQLREGAQRRQRIAQLMHEQA